MNSSGYPEFYQQYIEKIPEDKDPFELLTINLKNTIKTLAMVSDNQANKGYAEGKWSIKEVVQHLIDTERIFCFRALAFARGEAGKLPGYDHNEYAANCQANSRTLKSLLEEMKLVRASTISLFKSFSKDMLLKVGNANGLKMTAGQVLHILIGHELHHVWVLDQKYL
ncbi:MAG: putative damage-inducible protein DinB [Vicingaceae bacterium]|jgi:uncharacterized damage-inducible protein DinB